VGENQLIQQISDDVRELRSGFQTLSNTVAAGFADGKRRFEGIEQQLTAVPSCDTCDTKRKVDSAIERRKGAWTLKHKIIAAIAFLVPTIVSIVSMYLGLKK
jgi:hypothetical protein